VVSDAQLLGLVGANSARGFRRVSRRVVLFDEVDGYLDEVALIEELVRETLEDLSSGE